MSCRVGDLDLRPRRLGDAPGGLGPHGRLRLDAGSDWVVSGPAASLALLSRQLQPHAEVVGNSVLLSFGNSVGWFHCDPIGSFEVVSNKWTSVEFDQMLLDLAAIAGALPFGLKKGGWAYQRDQRVDRPVLLHQFLYLRRVLDAGPGDPEALLPALRLILADPHRRLDRAVREVGVDRCTAVRPGELAAIASGSRPLILAGGRGGPLVTALGGRLPEKVAEGVARTTHDTAENRFVKHLLRELEALLTLVEIEIVAPGNEGLQNLTAEVHRLRALLAPSRRARLWRDVGELDRLPLESPVLQRRSGYRVALAVHARLRLGARVPPLPREFEQLLALRDIAALYELWCYFRMAALLSSGLGEPVFAEAPAAEATQLTVRWGVRIAWRCGSQLLYNATFSRSAERRAYSVGMRPDITLELARGPNQGLHLFDAKFKVRGIGGIDQVVDSPTDVQGSEARTFSRGDLEKMHAYRDAIPSARSAWVLYPGSEHQFWPEHVHGGVDGVGVMGLAPKAESPALLTWLLGIPPS